VLLEDEPLDDDEELLDDDVLPDDEPLEEDEELLDDDVLPEDEPLDDDEDPPSLLPPGALVSPLPQPAMPTRNDAPQTAVRPTHRCNSHNFRMTVSLGPLSKRRPELSRHVAGKDRKHIPYLSRVRRTTREFR
jgi:hypothetical protein